ncbi:MAG: hypothetical protein IKT94_02860, partial [Rikenellaceae bacterium]|nr:hypothetical protein [Rikenellaceae bacterium]
MSRTSVAANGLSTLWSVDDQIAVWATNGTTNVLNAHPFKAFYSIGNYAEFTTDIDPMGEGEFTYYATHPVPASISGTTATFPIESVQQGSFDGTNDILVAYPSTGLALENEDAEVNLTFKHKMHTLRMFVPDNVEGMGEPIRSIEITFPTQVVGDVSVDYTSATTPATLSNGSNVVTVEIPEGLSPSSDSDRKYAYAIVFPATMSESDQITFAVRTDNFHSEQSFSARSLSEGGSTPVRLTCTPNMSTILRFSIKDNFLGEDPIKVTLQTADNEFIIDPATTFYQNGHYDLDVTDMASLAGQTMTVIYESEHAIVNQTLTIPNYNAGQIADVELTVPYLFFEDFSQIGSFTDDHDDAPTGFDFDGDTYNNVKMLDDEDSHLAGWSGGHIGGQAGTSIRIMCRYEAGMSANAYYKGRVDTRAIGGIKSTANISITFDYATAYVHYFTSGGSVNSPIKMYMGYTTTTGAVKPDSGSTDTSKTAPTNLPNKLIDGKSISENSGGYDSGFYTHPAVVLNSATADTRLSWVVSSDIKAKFLGGNGNFWIYIDNIKVSIAK